MKRAVSVLALALFSAMALAACGSGGGGAAAQTSSGGNMVSGRVALSSDMASSARVMALEGDTGEPYAGAIVELVDSEGNVVAQTTADENGNFNIDNVAQGDYTIRVTDPETGEVVTEVDVSIVDGDDVLIEGMISAGQTDWAVEFTANTADLQNDAQNQKAKNIAMESGATLDEVLAMREQGMGWGAIAQQLGVHPSVLGLGNDKGFEKDKETDASGQSVSESSKGGKSNNGGNGGDKPDKGDKGGKPDDNPGHGGDKGNK